MKRKIIIVTSLLLISIFAITLTGCGKDKETVEVQTGAISIKDAKDGLYIMTEDGELYAPNTVGQNFKTETTSANPQRIIVSHENEKYIPKLYKNDKLVYFSSTSNGVPKKFTVEKFRNSGYTIGLYNLQQASTGYYTFNASALLEDSDLKKKIEKKIENDNISLVSLDDEKLKDEDLNKAGCIDDMEEDGKVKLGLMKGTKYAEVETIADTVVFYSVSTHAVGSYRTTKNGYIEFDLPENITSGFISINNTGLIQVMDEERITK